MPQQETIVRLRTTLDLGLVFRFSLYSCILKELGKILSANMKPITADIAVRSNSLLTIHNI